MKFKPLAALALVALGLAGQANASVVTFNNVNDATTLKFYTVYDGATLLATAGFTLTSLSTTSATFGVTVNNASSGIGQNQLMSFGITTVSPTLSGSSDSSSVWDSALKSTLPGFQTIDLCIYAANGCSGGNINQGLAEGLTSQFSLTLTTAGNFQTSGISFASPYGVKFQGVGNSGNSVEFAGCIQGSIGCDTPVPPTGLNVPEPGSLALVGIGLIGAAVARRRRN